MSELLTRPTVTLTPAYGRDYKSAEAVIKDFEAEKDFVLQPEGQYINKQQIATGANVKFRYAKQTEVHFHTVTR